MPQKIFRDLPIFFRSSIELWKGLNFLRHTKKAVTIFGSARLPDTHAYCQLAHDVAKEFSKKGFSVITGGGPGIMQAANRGAYESGGHSIGINITLPHEQRINPFVTASLKCRYFFIRKVLLARYSEVFVIFPGGFGTLDELFELVTLVQTGKMKNRPVILVGRKFWTELLNWFQNTLLTENMINESELSRIQIVDSAQEALALVAFTTG